MARRYHAAEHDDRQVIGWGWFFALTTFISGCLWGATSILFLQTDNLGIMLFMLMTLTGITVGSAAALANFAWSYYAFAIPSLLPFAYALNSTGNIEFVVLGAMLMVFLLLQLVIAKKNQSTLDESIILRNQNTDLIQQLHNKKEKAESTNVAKTRFLAAASHDLRQPLHAMSLFIDGTAYTFYCGRNSVTADEYNVGCNYGSERRLNFSKAREVNGGEVKVAIVDSPDPALFDSPYGVSFECSITGATVAACDSVSVFEYDSASTTINMTDVVTLQSANSTGEDGGTYVEGDASHTVSTSIKLSDVPYYQ